MESPLTAISNVVIFQYIGKQLYITLVRDDSHKWSLPSTRILPGQTSFMSLEHELRTTIGLKASDIQYKEQLYTQESVRGGRATLCVSYIYLSRGTNWHKGSEQIGLFPIRRLPKLAAINGTTIHYALERLHAKALYSTVLSFLLPKEFTMLTLQESFETVTGKPVDRRNFRKKMNDLDVLNKQNKTKQVHNARTHLYSFKDADKLLLYSKPFLPSAT